MNAAQCRDYMVARLAVGAEGYDIESCWIIPPVDALPKGEFEPFPEDSYCPVTFNAEFGVPEHLSSESNVLLLEGVLWVCVHDGGRCSYFKFKAL